MEINQFIIKPELITNIGIVGHLNSLKQKILKGCSVYPSKQMVSLSV